MISARLEGMGPVQQELRALTRALDHGKLLAKLTRAVEPVRDRMRANLRKKTGATAAQVAIAELPERTAEHVAAVQVGLLNTGKGGRTHIGRFLEFGYTRFNKRTGRTSHIPAYPWAAPAIDSSRDEVDQRAQAGVQELIDEARR